MKANRSAWTLLILWLSFFALLFAVWGRWPVPRSARVVHRAASFIKGENFENSTDSVPLYCQRSSALAWHVFVARKKSILRIQITYGWGRAAIISQCKCQEQEITYLMVAYLLFLSKYFYICDHGKLA